MAKGFKERPKRDKKIDEFVGGADVSTNEENVHNKASSDSGTGPNNESNKVPYSTKLDEQIAEQIRAAAYAGRKSQREVLKEAMEKYYDMPKYNLKEDLKIYRNKDG